VSWQKLRYFKKEKENWGDPDLIDQDLLVYLDEFRHYLKTPVYVISGTRGLHSVNSLHYKGWALDIVIPNYDKSPLDLIFSALRFPFNGVGYYPGWWFKHKMNVVGGLHIDIRRTDHKALWLCSNKVYTSMSAKNLKKSGVL